MAGSDGNQDGEPVTNTITQIVQEVPEQSQVNPWASTLEADAWFYFHELIRPRFVPDSDRTLWSGHSWDATWIDDVDEIDVHTYISDYEIEPPYTTTYQIDEEMTYWDGTDIDAEAWRLHERLNFLQQGGKFDDSMTFNVEEADKWTVETWRDKGEAPEQVAKPTNEFILESEAGRTTVPFHPKFTRKWVERFEDAGGEDATDDLTSELANVNITFMDAAREGYGSGLYEIRSPEDVTGRRIIAHMREDHPNAEHATIERVRLLVGDSERRHTLINQGEIDIGDGIIQETGGRHNRRILPDYIQEIDRYLDNGGDQLLLNNNNTHLGHMTDGVPWVRRAIVAAVDWEQVGANGWGPERSLPLEYDTGMLKSVSEKYFSEEFLSSLYKYPSGADTDTAAEWLENAGYTQSGGNWESPDGERLSLSMAIVSDISDWVGAAQTVKQNLENFGVELELDGVSWEAYSSKLEPSSLDYDVAIQWGHNGVNAWDVYWSAGEWGSDPLLGGDPDGGAGVVDATSEGAEEHDTVDNQGNPLEVEIPEDPGSLTLDGATESIDVADLVHSFRAEELTEEELLDSARKCARYYNFYLPDYMFHQYNWGLWGNVREFRFPERGHPVNRVRAENDEVYPVLAGIPQVKYSEDYEPP